MKLIRTLTQLIGALAASWYGPTLSAQITFGAGETPAGGIVVPDPPMAGVARTLTVSTSADSISALNITLDIGSAPGDTAWNGDLYAQITSPAGTLAVLLNRTGVAVSTDAGYSDHGYSVTITDSAANNIHFYQSSPFALNGAGQLTGTWSSDGRSAPTIASRDRPLSALLGENPNGVWTLFVADLVSGNQAQLNSWSVSGTGASVPEPATEATLIAFGLALFGCSRRWRPRA
jgi:subtilisin-like proprotein convertase family protein